MTQPNNVLNTQKHYDSLIEEAAKEYSDHNYIDECVEIPAFEAGAIQMAQWKDDQYKTAYVVTRSEEHCDYVEKVFFDKEKAEEYCKPFNEDENSYHRNITEIEVSL